MLDGHLYHILAFGAQRFERRNMEIHNDRVSKSEAKVDTAVPVYADRLLQFNPNKVELYSERAYELEKVSGLSCWW